MALNYKLPRQANEYLGTDGKFRPDVEACILATLSTTIGCLKTEADAREHHARAAFLARLDGSEPWFSVATALALVGLETNVAPRRTTKAWGAVVVEREVERLRRRHAR